MTPSDEETPAFDPEAVREQVRSSERAKRMTEGRGVIHDLKGDERFARVHRAIRFTPVRRA